MINRGEVKDRIGAAAALAVALVKARAAIWLVTTNISADEVAHMGSRRFETMQAALDTALQVKGDMAQVTILHEATEILPILPS